MECQDLSEAAVVARADKRWGEVPVAVVVRKSGSAIDEAGVMALFNDRVARFQHPKVVMFFDALPRSSMGKVLKNDLRKLVN